jgi:hypothetical protein
MSAAHDRNGKINLPTVLFNNGFELFHIKPGTGTIRVKKVQEQRLAVIFKMLWIDGDY